MKDYKILEDLVSCHIKAYEDGFNTVNTEQEIRFNLTQTNHKVDVQGVQKWAAYLRLERMIKPKDGKDEEWEHLLIYSQAYKFKDTQERLNPEAPWKYLLYMDLIGRLIAGGLEYGELLKRMQNLTKNNVGKPISDLVEIDKPNIIVTSEMPKPLNQTEQEYLEWVKKNNENANK